MLRIIYTFLIPIFIIQTIHAEEIFTDEERAYLKDKQRVTMCIDPDWMPFEKIEDGKHIGMTSEHFKLFEKKIGIPIVMLPTKTWTESIEFAKERKCDIFSLAMATKDRKEYMNFTQPYLEAPLVITTRMNTVFISDPVEVIDKPLGITKGYAYIDILKEKYPQINLIQYETLSKGLEAVKNGEIFGYVDNLITSGYAIQNKYYAELKIAGKFDDKWSLGIGVRNDEPLMLQIFEKAIALVDDEEYSNILNRWVNVRYENGPEHELHYKVIIVFVSVLLLFLYRNLTLKKFSDKLAESQRNLQAIIENEPECVKIVDQRGKLIEMNPAGLTMLEASTLEEAQGQALTNYILPKWQAPFIELHKKVMSGESGKLEFEVKGLKGTNRWLETNAVPMKDVDGNVTSLLGITRDVTDRKLSEQRITHMASHDSLTGLANRSKLNEQLEYIMHVAKRNKWNISFMFLDIDNFKNINDTLGHSIGDSLLIEFAKRIESAVRKEDIVARLGGDEFIIVLPETDSAGAQDLVQKIMYIIREVFTIKEHRLSVTASIGISVYPDDGKDQETLYSHADAAMYKAKDNGKNSYSFFTQEMQKNSKRIMDLNNALYNAIENDELHIVYQPQISVKTGRVIGVEALLRWESKELGSVSPVEFIPIAESSGMIIPIGEWVIRSVAKQFEVWVHNGMYPVIMAVNLSAVQFRQPDLLESIEEILADTDMQPHYLELELTESVTMNHTEDAIKIMNSIHEKGIRIAIDDFGTGYSSLSYLKKLKAYKLKIDKSFVRDIHTDPEDKAIVSAIINMADSLGLITIAEGVETYEQLEYLKEMGCKEIQGYYYSKPLVADEVEKFIKNQY